MNNASTCDMDTKAFIIPKNLLALVGNKRYAVEISCLSVIGMKDFPNSFTCDGKIFMLIKELRSIDSEFQGYKYRNADGVCITIFND